MSILRFCSTCHLTSCHSFTDAAEDTNLVQTKGLCYSGQSRQHEFRIRIGSLAPEVAQTWGRQCCVRDRAQGPWGLRTLDLLELLANLPNFCFKGRHLYHNLQGTNLPSTPEETLSPPSEAVCHKKHPWEESLRQNHQCFLLRSCTELCVIHWKHCLLSRRISKFSVCYWLFPFLLNLLAKGSVPLKHHFYHY